MLKTLLRQRWMLIGLSCFLAFFSILVYDAHRELTSTWYIKGNISAAELKQLETINTTPPDSENGFSEISKASVMIHNVQRRNPVHIRFDFREPFPPDQKDLLQKYINRNTDALSLIYKAMEYPCIYMPHCHNQEQYDEAYSKVYSVTSLLNYRILDAAVRNDIAQLDEAINTSRLFFQKLSHRNYLEDEITRLSILTWSISYMEKVLCYAFPSPAAIREYLALFSINEKHPFENARMAIINETINLSPSHELFTESLKSFREQSDVMCLLGMASMEWSQLPFIATTLFTQKLTHTLALGKEDIYTASTFYRKKERVKAISALHGSFYPPVTSSAYIYEVFAKKIAYFNTVRVALASLLYYYDHNRMPDTLEDLVPDYLDTIPRDPFTPNQPIRYRIDGDVARFYSIGENEIDNHGLGYSYARTKNTDCSNCDDIVFRLKVPQSNIPLAPPSKGDL